MVVASEGQFDGALAERCCGPSLLRWAASMVIYLTEEAGVLYARDER
ncbi:MAG: hypothetical protein H7Z43_12170 [Clostridia bacterium]|nr:hypothetical protein [Deltaproteobacteria bacterium]